VTSFAPLVAGRTVAVVLAAGEGTRFAGDSHKLLAPFRGRPVLAWALDAATRSDIDEVVVVTGDLDVRHVTDDFAVTVIHNPLARSGQGSSLGAALHYVLELDSMRTAGPHDQHESTNQWTPPVAVPAPQVIRNRSVETGLVSAIVVGLGDQPLIDSSAWSAVAACHRTPIAIATYDGRRGQPVRLARNVWPELDLSGDAGARSLITLRPDLVSEVPCSGNPVDIDTVEDLARWNS
jgi:molybdenum cofactor cytidylyltransferase